MLLRRSWDRNAVKVTVWKKRCSTQIGPKKQKGPICTRQKQMLEHITRIQWCHSTRRGTNPTGRRNSCECLCTSFHNWKDVVKTKGRDHLKGKEEEKENQKETKRWFLKWKWKYNMVIPTKTEGTRGEIKAIGAKLKKEKSQINDLATWVEWTEKQEQTTPS